MNFRSFAKKMLLVSGFLLVQHVPGAWCQMSGPVGSPLGSSTAPTATQPYANRIDPTRSLNTGTQSAISEDLTKIALKPGFLLSINVADEPDLQGAFRINNDGDLDLPSVGAVHAVGETIPTLRQKLVAKLVKDQIMIAPIVSVDILEYPASQVTIVGEVVSPGRYPLLTQHSLIDVLSLAGGPTQLASDEVEITHAGAQDAKPENIRFLRDSQVSSLGTVVVTPGDTVHVKRAGIVYVMGAVNRPGGYVMQDDGAMNALQALTLANGPTTVASSGTFHVLRPNSDGSVVDIPIDMGRLTAGKIAPFMLQARDVLYVPTSKMKSFMNHGASIIATTSSAAIYKF